MEEFPTNEDDSPHEISFACGAFAERVDPERIAQVLRAVLARYKRTKSSLSLALVDDAEMIALHDKYLNIPETTDVLTFDLEAGDADAVDGEIIICADTAQRESTARGHGFADEVTLYAVHGLLHLLGYDDHSEQDATKMHAREDELLVELGIGPVYRGTSS